MRIALTPAARDVGAGIGGLASEADSTATGQSVWDIEPLTEAKTVWHPVGL